MQGAVLRFLKLFVCFYQPGTISIFNNPSFLFAFKHHRFLAPCLSGGKVFYYASDLLEKNNEKQKNY